MTIEYTTKQTYERKLGPVEDYLRDHAVENIKPETIDNMIYEWKSKLAIRVKKGEDNKQRVSFSKELDALKVVLNFYRMRKDPRFPIPIYREHYRAAEVVRKADHGVKSLKASDLPRFFSALASQKNKMYLPLAVTQFCLSLRIQEVCGLMWEDIDFVNNEITIQRVVTWDQENWEAAIKERPKNGKARTLPLPDILSNELRKMWECRAPSVKLIFHRGGRLLIRKSVGRAYNRALTVCGITYVSGTHLLRKTAATQANAITGDFHAVSESLGHSNVEETQRYVEGVSESKRKVAKALNGFVQNVFDSGPGPQWPTTPQDEKIKLVKSRV